MTSKKQTVGVSAGQVWRLKRKIKSRFKIVEAYHEHEDVFMHKCEALDEWEEGWETFYCAADVFYDHHVPVLYEANSVR